MLAVVMAMPKPLFFTVNIAAGESGEKVLYTVPDGVQYKLKKVIFYFDYGTNYKVGVQLFKGLKNIAPENSYAREDGRKVICDVDVPLKPNDVLYIRVLNEDTANSFVVNILLEVV